MDSIGNQFLSEHKTIKSTYTSHVKWKLTQSVVTCKAREVSVTNMDV